MFFAHKTVKNSLCCSYCIGRDTCFFFCFYDGFFYDLITRHNSTNNPKIHSFACINFVPCDYHFLSANWPIYLPSLGMPPATTINPTFTFGRENLAISEANTISQANTVSNPPPIATPLTASIIGFSRLNAGLALRSMSWVGWLDLR